MTKIFKRTIEAIQSVFGMRAVPGVIRRFERRGIDVRRLEDMSLENEMIEAELDHQVLLEAKKEFLEKRQKRRINYIE